MIKNMIGTGIGILLLLTLLSCSNSSGGSNDSSTVTDYSNSADQLVGIWLEKRDADELRSTGKLTSRCDDILNHGGIMTNSINIASSGRVTGYTEDPSLRDLVFIGNFNFSTNILNLSDDWAKSFGVSNLQGHLKDGVLDFGAEYNSFIFVQSSDLEMISYYNAQHACYNK